MINRGITDPEFNDKSATLKSSRLERFARVPKTQEAANHAVVNRLPLIGFSREYFTRVLLDRHSNYWLIQRNVSSRSEEACISVVEDSTVGSY